MSAIRRYLTCDDAEKIRLAVGQAESRTRGEIVPMIVRASDAYAHIRVMGGLVFAVTAFVIGLALWPAIHPSWLLLLEIGGYFTGSVLFRIDRVMRLLLTDREMGARVFDRALRAFYEHNLHATREATGILILASLLERRVQILADRGIHQKVGDAAWRSAAEALTRALKEKRAGDGFCEAISMCGDLLARHFPVSAGNPDELPNTPIQSE
jgi:putative membrane protein